VINFWGITPVFVPYVCKLNVPRRVQFFLWLMSHNKFLTRDNLSKPHHLQDVRCLFCAENESVEHLCFSCDIVNLVWREIGVITKNCIGESYESVTRLWIINKKNCAINTMILLLCGILER
jgi:hypothetical protein